MANICRVYTSAQVVDTGNAYPPNRGKRPPSALRTYVVKMSAKNQSPLERKRKKATDRGWGEIRVANSMYLLLRLLLLLVAK